MFSTPSIDPNAVQDVDFFLYEIPEDENPKQKDSQVSFQNEKIQNLTQSRLPSVEEQSNNIDDEIMHISWIDYVEEVGDDLEKVKEEEYAISMESTCNYRIEELD
eukprot:560834-Ditylum_brightwellii.AAC.1